MNIEVVDEAIVEAKRFLKRCDALKKHHTKQGVDSKAHEVKTGYKSYWRAEHIDGGKHTGAVKRASMDLSRALAKLRA